MPEVTYTASNANAQVSVQMPASLPGNCVIRVTAEDEATVFTYTIELLYNYSRDMGLASVTVGGSVWSSFDPAVEPNYYYIEKGNPFPISVLLQLLNLQRLHASRQVNLLCAR